MPVQFRSCISATGEMIHDGEQTGGAPRQIGGEEELHLVCIKMICVFMCTFCGDVLGIPFTREISM